MKKLGITPKLTLIFVIFAGAVLVGLSIPAYNNGRAALEAATVSELLSTAVEKQAALDNWVADRQHSIGDIANQAHLRENVMVLMAAVPGSLDAGRAHADLVTDLGNWSGEGHRFLSMEVIDAATGRVIAATDASAEGKFREEQPYFINGLQAAFVQNPYYDLSRQRPGMTAAAPVLSPDERVIAVLAGPLNMDEMSAIIQRRSGLHQTDEAFLVNTSNLFVTQPRLDPDPAVLQRGIHSLAVNRCLAHITGVIAAPDYRDVPAFIIYRWLPERQLCLVTKLDQDEALAPSRALASTMALTGCLVLLIGSIVAFGMSRTISRPVRQLVQGAEQIGQGNLDTRIEVKSGDEIGKLGMAFNEMAVAIGEKETQLRQAAAVLEQRVEQRTTELSASEERYRILSETSPDMIFVIGQDDKIQYVNNRAASQFGKTPEQVIGEARTELFPPGIAENQALGLQQVLKSGEPSSSESPITFPGGQLWLDTQLVPLRDAADEISAVMGVSRDITERKHAEEALLASEARYRSYIDATGQIGWVTNADGEIVEDVPSFRKFTGQTWEETKGSGWAKALHPDDVERTLQVWNKAVTTKSPYEIEYRMFRHDGVYRFLLARGFPVFTEDGSIREWVGTLIDITERKHAEEELKETRDFLENLLDYANAPIIVWDPQFRITRFNHAFEAITGRSAQEVLGKPLDILFPPAQIKTSMKLIQKTLTGERWEVVEISILHVDGSIRIVLWNSATLFSADGKLPIATIAQGQDITERKRVEDDLRIKNQVFDDAVVAQSITDPAAVINACNPEFLRMWGYATQEQVISQRVDWFLANPEEAGVIIEALGKEGVWKGEYLAKRADGTTFITRAFISSLLDNEGKLVGYQATNLDVTKEKESEEQIKKLNAELELMVEKRTAQLQDTMELNLKIIESSPLGVFACRADGPCIIANSAVARISGAPVEKMLQLNFRQLESWKKNGLFDKVEAALATGKEQRAEIHLTTVFNKDAWITYYITTFSNNGQPHFLMLVDDITERKLAEQALREGEERIQLIVEQTRDYAMFMLDPSGNVVTWNIGAERIEQFSEAEIIGKHFSIFHSPEEIQIGKPEAELQTALAQGRYEEDGLRVRKDGSTFWANIIVTPLKDESGNLRGFSKVTRDITERKQAEEELLKYREHLEELVKDRTEEVRKAMDNLARSNAELERFAYVASHDLQEPLRMVTSYLQLLERRYKDKLDGDALEFINYAVDGSNRMKTLISDLLAYSRVGTRGKEFALVNCEDVLARVLTNLQVSIEENKAKVTHDPLPQVMADNVQLESLFQNLLGNAIKFHGKKSPRIHVGLKKDEMSWVFSVSDNGIGIDPQYFERIFIIFQRLHNREEYPGTGIGLAISKRIVERHGGRMWIESQPEKGSTFFFTLPFMENQND